MDDLLDKQMNELLVQRKYLYSRSYKEKDLIAKAKLSKEAKSDQESRLYKKTFIKV